MSNEPDLVAVLMRAIDRLSVETLRERMKRYDSPVLGHRLYAMHVAHQLRSQVEHDVALLTHLEKLIYEPVNDRGVWLKEVSDAVDPTHQPSKWACRGCDVNKGGVHSRREEKCEKCQSTRPPLVSEGG